MLEGLFYLFALSIVLSGIMVISALNPVHSVLWLIVAFVSAAALFILLEVDFIALIFLIVYVGAIAILFLFVIMMLNLTDLERGGIGSKGDMSNYLPAGFIIGVVFLFEILIFHLRSIRSQMFIPQGTDLDYSVQSFNIGPITNIEVLGRVLYTNYYYLFILASFILLVAMIGAIVLTHDTGAEIKRQDIFIQTSRQLWV